MIILGYLRLSPVSKVWLGELFELLARNLDNGDDVVVSSEPVIMMMTIWTERSLSQCFSNENVKSY